MQYKNFTPQRPSAVKRLKIERRKRNLADILLATFFVIGGWASVWLWYFALGF